MRFSTSLVLVSGGLTVMSGACVLETSGLQPVGTGTGGAATSTTTLNGPTSTSTSTTSSTGGMGGSGGTGGGGMGGGGMEPVGAVVSAGKAHSCVALPSGTVRCWGRNSSGQLGNNSSATSNVPVTPTPLSATTALGVTCGDAHTCTLRSDGTAECFGFNAGGQLGDGTNTTAITPVAVTGLNNLLALDAGGAFTCGHVGGGQVSCWGTGTAGQLGNGSNSNFNTPQGTSIANVIDLSAGADHACAVLTGGAVQCWGDNQFGALGSGTTGGSVNTPQAVLNVATGVEVASGAKFGCVLLGDETVVCMGYNGHGQIGGNTTICGTCTEATPVAVAGLTGVAQVTAGLRHACALLGDGTVRCWGDNENGQLGNNDAPNDAGAPVPVMNLSGVVSVSAGEQHTCAALADESVWCWGLNTDGQLGTGDNSPSAVPVQVVGL